jgi:hypothetical protein
MGGESSYFSGMGKALDQSNATQGQQNAGNRTNTGLDFEGNNYAFFNGSFCRQRFKPLHILRPRVAIDPANELNPAPP